METNKKAVTLAQLISAHQKSNTKLTALANQVEELVTTGGEPNVITAVKNNGTTLEVTDKAVDIGPAVAAAVAGAAHLQRKKVASVEDIDLTAAGADQYIYMVSKAGAKNGDKYDEYMVLDGEVEKVGDWAVDLSGYETAEQSDIKLAGKVDKEDGKGLSSNDFTDAAKAKLDSITFATDEEVAAALAEIYGE